MADSTKKPLKLGMKRLYRLFGIYTPTEMPKQNEQTDIQFTNYTPAEMRHMAGFSKEENKTQGKQSTAELSNYLQTTAADNQNTIKEMSSLTVLTPEIGAARQIMIGSIMSPTDCQTGNINVIVDNTDLGEQVEQDVSRVLNDFFNNDMNLGERVAKWIGDALFEFGASAIMVLPQSNLKLLNASLDLQSGQQYIDPKSIKAGSESIKVGLEGLSDAEDLYKETVDIDFETLKDDAIIEEATASLEAASVFPGKTTGEIKSYAKDTRTMVKALLKEKRSAIIVSSDMTVINSSESRLKSKADKLAKQMAKNFLFDAEMPTFLVGSEMDDSAKDCASLIEIPASAVVPIIIPGNPHKHLMYFVLVDQWGTPLVEKNSDLGAWQGSRKMSDSAMQAAFGKPVGTTLGDVGDGQRYETTMKIFGLTVKNLMDSKLEEFGLNGASVSDHEAVTNCMFRQLVLKRKVGLIAVPESMMVYYRFDHHADGTGKALIEDMKTLLSLRTTLLVSYIMAATENSIDHKTLEVSVDEKQANIEQFLEIVNQTFVEKKMLRFNNNPQTVQRDLVQKAVTIMPKGIRGLQDSLNITTDRKSAGSVMPDTDLLEKLSEWVVAFLEVPAAAMNQLGQSEFSRSVATTNLFFNNNIKGRQKVTNLHTTKLIRILLMFNAPLRERIIEILKATAVTEEETDASSSDEAKKADIDGQELVKNDDTINKNLQKIIQNVKTTLPQPKIVIDKAQYQELTEYTASLDKIVNDLYPDELLGPNGGEYGDIIKLIRAVVKAQMIRDYIDNIGFQSTYEIPLPDKVDVAVSDELMLRVMNIHKRFADVKAQIGDKLNSGDIEEETDTTTETTTEETPGESDSSYSSTSDTGMPVLEGKTSTKPDDKSDDEDEAGAIW